MFVGGCMMLWWVLFYLRHLILMLIKYMYYIVDLQNMGNQASIEGVGYPMTNVKKDQTVYSIIGPNNNETIKIGEAWKQFQILKELTREIE